MPSSILLTAEQLDEGWPSQFSIDLRILGDVPLTATRGRFDVTVVVGNNRRRYQHVAGFLVPGVNTEGHPKLDNTLGTCCRLEPHCSRCGSQQADGSHDETAIISSHRPHCDDAGLVTDGPQ